MFYQGVVLSQARLKRPDRASPRSQAWLSFGPVSAHQSICPPVFPGCPLTGYALPHGRAPPPGRRRGPAAKLPRTTGGKKGEGWVPPAEKGIGERDGGDEEGEEGEEEGRRRVLTARHTG